jgi:hypothetical protein
MDQITPEARHVAKILVARYGAGATFRAWTQLEMRIDKEDDTASFWVEVVTVLLDWQKPHPEAADSIH